MSDAVAASPAPSPPGPTAPGRLSVRWRITVVAAAVVAVGLALAGVVVLRSARWVLEDRIRNADQVAVDTIARALERGADPARAARVTGLRRLLFVQIVDAQGQVVAASPVLRDVAALGGTAAGPGMPISDLFDVPEADWLTTEATAQRPSGPLTVVGFSPSGDVDRATAALRSVLVVTVPVLIVLVGLLTWVLVGRALHPVDAIRSEVDEISGTSLDRRVPEPGGDDEIARLARTMNGMLDRLERASHRQQRFVSDASHELRSPLSAIRTDLEVALREGDAADWPGVAGAALGETERMEHLVVDLLELARLDEVPTPVPATPVDLDELVLAETARPSGRIEVGTAGVSGGRVRGDREQLRRVVRNLLDNGVRHARSRVDVVVRTDGPVVVLEVVDDGPGVPPADRERVFERFARLDEGRIRTGGGYGLGLALTRSLVERHGGTVGVSDGPAGGARFVVRLPAV
ncbi:MAG: HAMP domain-containing protein [Acidimicrobiales bacterium]|nr:HAMP domain-containing protein [Acidimicrobiales bacterium]